MKNVHKVVWEQGMFLQPHHFQQSDRYSENISWQRLRNLFHFHWGISELSISQESITNGVFFLERLSGIMPDGSFMDIGNTDTCPESRSFQDHFIPSMDNLEVFLGIRLYGQDDIACNLDTRDRFKIARFIKEEITVLDENTALNERSVSVAKKNLKILFSEESLDGYSTLKIASINRSGNGYCLDENYICPLLDIGACPALMKIIRRILENLKYRNREFSDKRRQKSLELAELGPSDLANFFFLKIINSYLPVLNHFYQLKCGHPEQLYLILAQLAGELTTFSMEGDSSYIPVYTHSDLTRTFCELDKKLDELLSTATPASKVVSITLQRQNQNIYTGEIRDETLFAGKFYLAIGYGDMRQDDIIRYVPEQLKIASRDSMDYLINMAMPGIPLKHLTVPPSSLPIKIGYEYFEIKASGELWREIKDSRNISIYSPRDLTTAELKLLITKE